MTLHRYSLLQEGVSRRESRGFNKATKELHNLLYKPAIQISITTTREDSDIDRSILRSWRQSQPCFLLLLLANAGEEAGHRARSAEHFLVDLVDGGIEPSQQVVFDPPSLFWVIGQTDWCYVKETNDLHLTPLLEPQAGNVEVGRDVAD